MAKIGSKIGNNIRQYRKRQGLSQDKLSKLADVSHIYIVKLELGSIKNPGVNTVQKIAQALKVKLEKLLQ